MENLHYDHQQCQHQCQWITVAAAIPTTNKQQTIVKGNKERFTRAYSINMKNTMEEKKLKLNEEQR